jgi:asparagine synthase (glutamine-hydrolysing)
MADVPVGILLSGGVDSSAILSLVTKEANRPIDTFTVGFSQSGVIDDRPYARLTAQRYGTRHHEITITADDFWHALPKYVWHMEDPVCEPPAIALHYVAKLARQHVKVVLSGEGGDEAFAGYPNYPHMLRVDQISRRMGRLSSLIRPVGIALGRAARRPGLQRYSNALGRPLRDTYFSRSSGPTTYFNRQSSVLFADPAHNAGLRNCPTSLVDQLVQQANTNSSLDQMLYIDTKTWLPDDLLVKADKMTMANSIELRVPLLDHKVLEFAASLPASHKIAGKSTKRVLKAAFRRELPDEILNRRKAGFPVPYPRWFAGPLLPRATDLILSSNSFCRQVFTPRVLRRALEPRNGACEYAKEVFSLAVLELWHQQFVGNRTP